MKGFTKGKGKGKKFIPTTRKKIAIGDNPEGDKIHNKFIDPKNGDGHRGVIIAVNKKRTEAILEAKTTSMTGGRVKEGKLFHVKEKNPEQYPEIIKEVKEIPKGFEPSTTREKKSLKETLARNPKYDGTLWDLWHGKDHLTTGMTGDSKIDMVLASGLTFDDPMSLVYSEREDLPKELQEFLKKNEDNVIESRPFDYNENGGA